MTPLHRHQLARLRHEGWQRVLSRSWDPTARACLAHWAERGLPLVVTRQRGDPVAPPDSVAMGLPAPLEWERRRIAIDVARADVSYFDEFPPAEKVIALLPRTARDPWQRLCTGLSGCGVVARVYGSYGWQHLTGLAHVRRDSDIDLWVGVSNPDQADAVASVLQGFSSTPLRLDGELMFAGGEAVAWREWLGRRGDRSKTLLVKTLAGALLCRASASHAGPAFEGASP